MREHIDFIQAQFLEWEPADAAGYAGARLKLLSRDDETSAISTVLQLPAGWRRDAGALSVDEEIYVLEGCLAIDGAYCREHGYAFIPAGTVANEWTTSEGATLLCFRSEPMPSDRLGSDAVAKRTVPMVDLTQGSWDGDFDRFGLGSMRDGARMRVLRQDPFSGETTYITATIAFRRGERAERHPIAQEFYMLAGELAGPVGTMQAGAYCIRPPMAKHAPYGSPTGALILFRGMGGEQKTFWEDTDPFVWHPQHQPILPERLKRFARPVPRPSRY